MEELGNIVVSPMKKMKILGESRNQGDSKVQDIIGMEKVLSKESDVVEEPEPLLQESINQYVIFPIKHDKMWHMYKSFVDNFWSPTDSLQNLDAYSFDDNEKEFLKEFSAIYAAPQSRGLVNENFAEEFSKIIQVTEAKFFYGHQLFVQNMHYEMYYNLFEKLVPSNDEQVKVFRLIEKQQPLQNIYKWVNKWKNETNLGKQLVASVCMHGLFFVALDLIVQWLETRSKRNLSQELLDIFKKMLFEQNLQRDFGYVMISNLKEKPAKKFIEAMINEAATLQFKFINYMPLEAIGFETSDLLQLFDTRVKAMKANIYQAMSSQNAVAKENEIRKKQSEDKLADMANEKANLPSFKNQKVVLDEDF